LPSKDRRKGPALDSYACYWSEPVPDSIFERWASRNIQLIAGTQSGAPRKIVVVDCDGIEAKEVWDRLCTMHKHETSGCWISRTGSGGYHFYFSLSDTTAACQGGMLWGVWDTFGDGGKGKWVKHKELRILGDRDLVVAPPSRHVDTGVRYVFLRGASPTDIPWPATAPSWLLALPRLAAAPRCYPEPKPNQSTGPRLRPRGGGFMGREMVLSTIPDKLALAREWGLKTARDGPNEQGWVPCRVPGRPDARPSGSFNVCSGVIQDRATMETSSLFDLGVALGRFGTWQECMQWCGERFMNPYREAVRSQTQESDR